MQQVLKVSTAATTVVGPVLDSTGASYTGAVIADLNLTKNGTTAAMAAAATLTHDHNGHYILVFTTGNTDTLGRLDVTLNKATYAMPPKCFEVLAATAFDTLVTNGTLASTTSGRTIVTDAAGLVDANTVKVGPTGAGTAQTAKDIGGAVPAVAAGASGGLLISGSNTGTTTFGALTVTGAMTYTGNVSMAGGLTITQSSANTSAVVITGTGSGDGIRSTGGTTGNGAQLIGGATSGNGLYALAIAGNGKGISGEGFGAGAGIAATGGTSNAAGISAAGVGTGAGLLVTGGATGAGFSLIGGSSSGAGITIATVSGDGISVTPTAGNALVLTANGTSKHGAVITGGTAGTSDGVKAVAGTGGVPIRGDITGNITGALSGAVGSVTGAVGSVTGAVGSVASGGITTASFAAGAINAAAIGADAITDAKVASDVTIASVTGAVGSVTGNVGGNVVGSVASVTAGVTVTTNNDKTGYSLTQTFPSNFSSLGISAAGKVNGVVLCDTLTTYTGNTVQTGDSYARLGAPVAASISADIAAVPAGVWAYVVENSKTALHYIRVIKAAVSGKLSGAATTTVTVRDDADSKARITATVDASGNRSAVTIDGT